jgi:hypothetical protein
MDVKADNAVGRWRGILSWLSQDRQARLFVWTVWLALFIVAVAFVERYAMRLPCGDDWTVFIPKLTGKKSVTLASLWHQDNEHRLPLIQLILLPIHYLTQGLFRVENFLNVGVLAGLAAMLIVAVRRLRGRQSYSDVFFPLALLHLGHFEVFMARLTLNHVLSAVLTGVVLLLLATQRGVLRAKRACLLAVPLLCLPLCGANGLPVVVLMALWLVVGARWGALPPGTTWGRLRLVHLGLAGLCLALVGLYFVDFHSPRHHPPPSSVANFLRSQGELMTMALGRWSERLWPWSGLVLPLGVAATLAALAMAWKRQPLERARTLGVACLIAAMVGLVLAMAWGRAELGPRVSTAPRYAVVLAPLLLAVYFASQLAPSNLYRRAVPVLLCAWLCLLYPYAARSAYRHGRSAHNHQQALLRAIREGAPVSCIAPRAAGLLYPPMLVSFVEKKYERLKKAGIQPFSQIAPEPEWLETPLDVTPAEMLHMTPDRRRWQFQNHGSYLLYRLPEPQLVDAVRIRFVLRPERKSFSWLLAYWGQKQVAPLPHDRRMGLYCLAPQEPGRGAEQTLHIWTHGTLDELRIHPDNAPGEIRIREITLLRRP